MGVIFFTTFLSRRFEEEKMTFRERKTQQGGASISVAMKRSPPPNLAPAKVDERGDAHANGDGML